MQSTIQLLEKALEIKPVAEWNKVLGLGKNTLHAAKHRGHLSPAIAGAIAEAMELDPLPWMAIAALESEKDSACKTRMIRRFATAGFMGATLGAHASAATLFDSAKSLLCALCSIEQSDKAFA